MVDTEHRIDQKMAQIDMDKLKLKKSKDESYLYAERQMMDIEDRSGKLHAVETRVARERQEIGKVRAELLR